MKALSNEKLSIIFSEKILLIIASFILPVLILTVIDVSAKIDVMVAYLIMVMGFPVFVYMLKKSLNNALIPYILLQLIFFSIFVGNKLPLPGFLKPYILVFGFSLLLTGYYILKNFKYLWGEFIVFRLLFVFLIFNIPYFLFYHSEFRTSNLAEAYEYSNMMENMQAALMMGISNMGRSFSGAEHKFVIYLGSTAALVGITVPLMLFKDTKDLEGLNSRVLNIIKLILAGFILHFIGAVLCIILGLSQIGFFGGRLGGDFIGDIGLGFHIYFSIFILVFIGFKIFINRLEFVSKEKKIMNLVLNFFIVLSGALVFLHLNKTSIILVGASLFVIAFFQFFKSDKKINLSEIFAKFTGLIKFAVVPLIVLMIAAMANMDFVDAFAEKLTDRFSNIDTLNDRFTMWEYFIADWINKLNVFTFLFGFGIDSSRELAFYTTYILAGRDYHTVQIHNIYLDIFHDYGMIGLLYVGSFVYMGVNNLKILFSKTKAQNLKLFSTISLAVLLFFMVYHMTDGMRIPFSIMFFCLLGFLESVKKAYAKYELREENE